jgi:ATP:cob(I)alamin adenosyltransferase
MGITTKTGDKGWTSTLKRRVKKTSNLINLIGALDKLISFAGILAKYDKRFIEIQIQIKKSLDKLANEEDIEECLYKDLEKKIEDLEKKIELKGFVRPYGDSAFIHYYRTLVREAERISWNLKYTNLSIFLNRLSDYVFLIAINMSIQNQELFYF